MLFGGGGFKQVPDDSIPEIPCPVLSSSALATDASGMPTKVYLEIPCRRRCPWFLERDGKPSCAVAVIALELAGRA